MKQSAKISVIMPVHNMADYLEQSVRSVLNQTLRDIEIICVDDASVDISYQILSDIAKTDQRIHVHHFEENSSAWAARKLGIEKATGEYIMFLDADDEIVPCACEELYHEMKEHPVDILHFDAEIINVNRLPQGRINSMQRFVKPYNGEICGTQREVFTACFDKRQYHFSLWNKLFSTELCKKALPWMKDAVLPKAQDKLAYFIISYFAQSYRGIPGRTYYRYYFGRGCTGYNKLTLQQFSVYCTMGRVADEVRLFLQEQGSLEQYAMIEQTGRQQLLEDCMERWLNEVEQQESAKAFDILLEYWQTDEVIGMLARKRWFARSQVAKKLQFSEKLKYDQRPVKTIATYYFSCVNGGVQRVLCDLSKIWSQMGYHVIVITDTEPTEKDYPIPASVKREMIPNSQVINRENYEQRGREIRRIIKENHVDAVVYHAWVLNMMLWDEISIKASGAAFIAHCHNVFTLGILLGWDSWQKAIAPYYCADAVVTLSEADRAFWEYYNNNVFDVINPFTDGTSSWLPQRDFSGHNIVWVGRLAMEKNPFDTLKIIKRVLEQVPDAVLHIVGGSKGTSIEENYRAEIARRGLQEHVIMEGFHTNVKPYYQNAQVFLMTSSYEGYSLTLQESKMAGIPCVMYELPYLTLCKGNRGIVSVKQRDVEAAAQEIVRLLTDSDRCARYGQEARRHVEELFSYDFEEKWRTILDSVSEEHIQRTSERERVMMETLIEHHEISLKKAKTMSAIPQGRVMRYAMLIQKGISGIKNEGVVQTGKRIIKKVYKKMKNIKKNKKF